MKKSLTLILTLVVGFAFAQTNAENDKVMEPINALFKGMHTGDSALVHRAFVSAVTFVSMHQDKNGKSVLEPEPFQEFLDAVGKPHTEKWSEPVWDVVVQIDGIFAQVWAQYAFYVGNRFSHCGVDAFHLIKGDDGNWKIFHAADTRRKEPCAVPDAIKDQFK